MKETTGLDRDLHVCVCLLVWGRHGQEPAPEEAIEQPVEPPSSAFTVTWPELDRNQLEKNRWCPAIYIRDSGTKRKLERDGSVHASKKHERARDYKRRKHTTR